MVPAAQGGTPAQQLLAAPGAWGRGDGLRGAPKLLPTPHPPHRQWNRPSVGFLWTPEEGFQGALGDTWGPQTPQHQLTPSAWLL